MKFILTLILLFSCTFAFSQNYFEITAPTFQGAYNPPEIEVIMPFYLHNNADTAAHYRWRREQLCDLPPFWENAVCDCSVCFPPHISAKPNIGLIEAKDACEGSFHYYFRPGSSAGSHSARVTFYNHLDSLNSTTSAVFSIDAGCVSGTGELEVSTTAIYPVPCTTDLFIESNTANITAIQLMDAAGRTIEDLQNPAFTTLKLDMTQRQKGVYYLRLMRGSQSVQVTKVVKM